ncbi:tRNA modification GTPase [Singulisphaera sp. GP187]|uniref:GTPase n=1 Tax=Singulisphaera sp. GP187 TaxID=1882752 RepID=UPI00092A5972|nr:GTPase [Singulisphaera sp. GP187]SIO12943.1 tRNA modification GTPase [Singulisphaera sp. GP187]
MSPIPRSPVARVCVLTPEGRGAIAVVRVWGPQAIDVANRAFRPIRGSSLAQSAPGRLRFGRVGADLGDEVVAVVVSANPPEVEIHCHGGSAALALVVNALETEGAERRQPVAWIRHASRSAVAAEADVDLMRAQTTRTAEILLEQAQGAFEVEIRGCIERLGTDPQSCAEAVKTWLHRSDLGLRLVSGWRVVLSGRPNVGKSRLLNALAGYERAIVAPTPGTTRDVVTVRTALDGWPVELADTAGLRSSDDMIEASGIALARARQKEADLVLLVLDRSEPLTDSDRRLIESHKQTLIVVNKCDLPAAWDPEQTEVLAQAQALSVSAERGDGIEPLGSAIARRLVPEPPPPGAGVPFRPGQVRHLSQALKALEANDPTAARQALGELLAPLPDRSPRPSSESGAESSCT